MRIYMDKLSRKIIPYSIKTLFTKCIFTSTYDCEDKVVDINHSFIYNYDSTEFFLYIDRRVLSSNTDSCTIREKSLNDIDVRFKRKYLTMETT